MGIWDEELDDDEEDYEEEEEQPQNAPLVDRILKSFVSSNFHDPARDYLPEGCLKDLVTQSAIATELHSFDGEFRSLPEDKKKRKIQKMNCDIEYREELATWIVKNAPRTFAVALQCESDPILLVIAMSIFRDNNFTDECLPIPDLMPSTRIFPPAIWTSSVKLWTPVKIHNFYEKQWKCLVPVFSCAKYDHDLLYDNYIFPFTKVGAAPKVGAFSFVHRVVIRDDHQGHVNMEQVAIKEIQIKRGNDKTGTNKAWEDEAKALASINELNHNHIIKCVAAIRRGDNRYFMFPWADGDSLRDYWDNVRWQCPTGDIISQAVTQLRGLADALVSLHDGIRARTSRNDENDTDDEDSINLNIQIRNEDNEVTKPLEISNPKNIRHGDLKPENILRFVGTGRSLGTLKIADMGLAKQHIVATQDRKHLTSTRYGTIRYEAPEAVDTLQGPRSRLYDIWSMGCITLEFIIWILYGNDELNNFYTQVQGGDKQRLCQYFEMLDVGQARRAEVHPVVLRWISHIEKVDPECQRDSATRDLIRLVREKLLVVPLPPNRASATSGGRGFAAPELGQSTTRYRATAVEFRDALDEIIAKISNKDYLLIGGDRDHIKPPRLRPSMPSTSTTQSRDRTDLPRLSGLQLRPPTGVLTGIPGVPIRPADYTLPPMKDWEFNVDNLFAESVLHEVGSKAMVPSTRVRTKLCNRCKALNFWASSFKLEDELSALHLRAKICDFCELVAMVCKHNEVIKNDKLQIERKQSNLMLTGDPYPVLSIIRSPEARPPLHIQLGFPELPNPQSDTFFSIVRLWLRNCNTGQDHSECRANNRGLLPTRLIDVGTLTHPQLRVIETNQERPIRGEYIALSHPWGDTRIYEPFSTLRKDDSGRQRDIEHFKKAIPYAELPATFRDAVDCTRRLEVRYLWIDSICIIQGLDGDFNEEAKKMEDVFSGAYCVLAASRASSQLDGFLGTRPQRQYVTFQRGTEKPFYVCRTIDNFSKDVIEGSLNKRGWVLQERALARRTVYFTETQTYFECGKGIRCETLTSMKNNMADFLGDPNFPEKAMRTTSRALKISWFQELYKQYSRLDFTRYEDRPLAIAGLEKRLQEAFGIKGGYGIFDDGNKANGGLFHRSLLWQRGEEESDEQYLIPIAFPAERKISVPSWSWMAYKGGISYADPPFESAIWERDDIVPSWTRGAIENSASLASDGGPELMATVRDFNTAGYKTGDIKLTYDTERTRGVDGQRARCVIIARSDDGRTPGEKRFYVLLVTAAGVRPGCEDETYVRVGAGYMLGKYIALDKPGTQARIV